MISEIRKERLRAGQRGELTEQELQARKGKLDQLRQNDSLEKYKFCKKQKVKN